MNEVKHRFYAHFWFLVGTVLAVLSSSPGISKSERVDESSAVSVSLSQLIAEPTRFDGKQVKIVGQFSTEIQPNSAHRSLILTCPANAVNNPPSPPNRNFEGVLHLSLSPELRLEKAIFTNELVQIEGVFQPVARTSHYIGSVTVTKLECLQHPSKSQDFPRQSIQFSPVTGYGSGPSTLGPSTVGDHGPALQMRKK